MIKKHIGYSKLFILLGSLLMVFSCKQIEEDPGQITVSLALSASSEESLKISQGKFFISELFIESQTESGKRTELNRLVEKEIDLKNGSLKELIQFQLPPAVYNDINIMMKLGNDNGQSAIYLKGERRGLGLTQLPFVFDNSSTEWIDIEAKAVSGNQAVVKRGGKNLITLEVKPQIWFQPIGLGQWLAGELRPFEGKETLWISPEENPEMFQIINGRIKQSFSAKFE
ncbi:hypothetical protein [Echinicola salinicaeni]|uniref:hypothetical protein n=1 Tax=Echinicola salinicaeni TaxID=2762757 RepID=UPI001644E524|nr:hypothetical protein [Echinicola salinicaeni]